MPFSPLNLHGLLAWYNLGQAGSTYTQTNCAVFVRASANPCYLYLPAASCSSWLDGQSKLTIALDVRQNDNARDGWVTRWDDNQAQFILRCQGSGAIIFFTASSLTDAGANYVETATGVLTAGLPARVVVVFDTGNVTIYVNGQQVATGNTGVSALTSGSTANLLVGADFNETNRHDGLMSRLCIWAGTALDATAVIADFNWWVGVDPTAEPVAPSHAWRLDEGGTSGTRSDCIGSLNLLDKNSNVGSEGHVSQINDLSGNGFHARIRPINGPTYVSSSGLPNAKPAIKHVAANGQFLVSGIQLVNAGVSGLNTKPYSWSLYAIVMCTSQSAPSGQSSNGFVNTFASDGADKKTWLVCVLGDTGGSGAPAGSIGVGCGDDTNFNQSNSDVPSGGTYSANTWFHLSAIFPDGATNRVALWVSGSKKTMTYITDGHGTTIGQACLCKGVAHQLVIGAAIAEGSGYSGLGIINNDFFDGQWADIAICATDTTSQRSPSGEEDWQKTYSGLSS